MTFNLFSGAPQDQAMLALAAGLLESGGPSRTPVSLGQGAARGMLSGREAFMQAQQAQQQQQLVDQKRKFYDLQMSQFDRARMADEERARGITALANDPRMAPYANLLPVNPNLATELAFPKPDAAKTPASIAEYEYAKSQGYSGSFEQWRTDQKKAGATQIKVPVNLAQDNYAKTVGTKTAERDITEHDNAKAAVEDVTKLNTVVNQLQSGTAITGMGAELQLDFERAKALFLKDKEAGKKVTETEYLRSLLGSDVFPMIKAMGIGARGLDTPAEREFLINVMTGAIPMNRETLLRMTKDRRDRRVRDVEAWNKRVEKGELDKYFEAQGLGRQTVDVPQVGSTPSAPSSPAMKAMPPASQHRGRIIEDSQGNRYKSDGMTWRKLATNS